MLALLGLIFIIVPVSTFLHEFGHAIGARLFKAEKITVVLGSGRRLVGWSVFSIDIHLHLFYFLHGATSSNREKSYSLWEEIIIAISGPFINFIVALLLLTGMSWATNSFITLLFLFNCWLCIVNLLPFKWKNRASDGYLILRNVKQMLAS